MKFLFEKFGAAVGVEQIFRGIAASGDLQADGAVLKCGANLHDALAMRMVKRFGNSQDRRQPPRDSFVAVVE